MMKLTELKGIGPKTEALFFKLGVHSQEELLRYYPAAYDAFAPVKAIADACEGEICAVTGRIPSAPIFKSGGRTDLLIATLKDADGSSLRIVYFSAPYMRKRIMETRDPVFRGRVCTYKGVRTMNQPVLYTREEYEGLQGRMLPVYGLTKGLTVNAVRKAVGAALEHPAAALREFLPEDLLRSYALPEEEAAVRDVHAPRCREALGLARRRLVFDDFFLFLLALTRGREERRGLRNAFPMEHSPVTDGLVEHLPFRLTNAQRKAWQEIEADLDGDHVMARLVQGDVGSGKTVVAFLAMLHTAANGYQAALMAPTEVLAEQHYEKLMKLKEEQGLDMLRPVLLTGSVKGAERRRVCGDVACGLANAVIGTHALFQEGVAYASLALVITDEQHRFGVNQRKSLADKGGIPHTMVMSATPIPRTLGIALASGIDVSRIDELPAGRLPIKNAVVDESFRDNTLRFLEKQLAMGRQAYVICPMIDGAGEYPLASVQEVGASLRKSLPGRKVGKLHGRMRPEEKNRVMEAFLAGEIDILVSTTVVEVGVDVPNASVILIENAERFGLAELHQLRGRVGRGAHQSYCILMAGDASGNSMERLQILKDSNDGAYIAEKDFALRGMGDLLGVRQSGEALFGIADLRADSDVLEEASRAVREIMDRDPNLALPEHAGLLRKLAEVFPGEEFGKTI